MSAAGDALGDSINNAIIALGTLPVPSQTIWRTIANILVAPGAGTAIPGLIVGGEISNNVTTPNTKLDVASGYCTDSTYTSKMTIQPWTIDLSASWAAGNGFGKLNTGATWTASTTYHIFVIAKADLSVIDFVVDTSTTPASLPGGCTLYRRIGSRQTDVAGNLIDVIQDGPYNIYKTIQVPISGVAIATTATAYSMGTPTGLKLHIRGVLSPGVTPISSSSLEIGITSPDQNTQTPAADIWSGSFRGLAGAATYNSGSWATWNNTITEFVRRTDNSGQLNMIRVGTYSGAAYQTTVQIIGYEDHRGAFGSF